MCLTSQSYCPRKIHREQETEKINLDKGASKIHITISPKLFILDVGNLVWDKKY